MTSIAPPAKIKAFLAAIKGIVDQPEKYSYSNGFTLLLRLELVQRGVLVDGSDDGDEGGAKLMQALRSTAGRPLLQSQLPPPLLAGSAALQGMVAEMCWNKRENAELSSLSMDLMQKVLDRCVEVEDPRLANLLLLGMNYADKSHFLLVAEGSFLRAASFQPDAPPMWKRAWDVILLKSPDGTPRLEAAIPLTRLIRIAVSKDNHKRAMELSLSLVESWLAEIDASDQNRDKFDRAFCAPYRPENAGELSALERVQRAQDAFIEMDKHSHDASLQGDDLLRYKLLALRVDYCREEALIQQMAQEQYRSAQNRSNDPITISSESQLEKFVTQARFKILASSLGDSVESTLDEHANVIRDAVLEQFGWLTKSTWFDAAIDAVRQQIERRRMRAKAMALESKQKNQGRLAGWDSVARFVLPILQSMESVCGWIGGTDEKKERRDSMEAWISNQSGELLSMVSMAAMASVNVVWLTCDSSLNNQVLAKMAFVHDMMMVAITICKRISATRDLDGVIRSKEDNEAVYRNQLLACHSAATALSAITSNVSSTSTVSLSIMEEILNSSDRAEEKSDRKHSDFGTAFFQFLVAWNGLHQAPWQFCNITQARTILRRAEEVIDLAQKEWGREPSSLETILTKLAKADAEGGRLVGGFAREAGSTYVQTLASLETVTLDGGRCLAVLMKCHCLVGLGRLALQGIVYESSATASNDCFPERAEQYGRESLSALEAIKIMEELPPIYLWVASATKASLLINMSASRQLVAEALVQAGRAQEAQGFLQDAVRDAPQDFDAAFALGAFRLHLVFRGDNATTDADKKQAQVLLLKAAKLNPTEAGPFALLGLWFEENSDLNRALGCFSKAILLDPAHPVAGRGLLRLQPFDKVKNLVETATNVNSALNGWAWRAIGEQKALTEGDDELASVAFLKALRCRDIISPDKEPAGAFFSKLSTPVALSSSKSECANVWYELAASYRRLGRYTAALRAYHSASDVAGDGLPSIVLCSWAQVEIELGLLDAAEEKFTIVLNRPHDDPARKVAAYGKGLALLSKSQRDHQEGKSGLAYSHLLEGTQLISGIYDSETDDLHRFGCVTKLLGDMYSFGAQLPPDVFHSIDAGDDGQETVRAHVSFVAKGEAAFRMAEKVPLPCQNPEEFSTLQSASVCDVAANILLQAQLLARMYGDTLTSLQELMQNVPDVRNCYERAAAEFHRSIQLQPLYAPAWCGLGCAVAGSDPLLAQHCFCRALQLDKLFPDAYSNLAFLYSSHNALSASASVLDALTQVADTPMMWINRAMILERSLEDESTETNTTDVNSYNHKDSLLERQSQASDAYRASLQVTKHPYAVLGLSLSCRVAFGLKDSMARLDSSCFLAEYVGMTGNTDLLGTLLTGVATLEDGIHNSRSNNAVEVVTVGKQLIRQALSGGIDAANVPFLDVNLIEKCITACEQLNVNGIAASQHGNKSLSSHEMIHRSDHGEQWLQLAKQLCQQAKDMTDPILIQAQTAAGRAAELLTKQLITQPKPKSKRVGLRREDHNKSNNNNNDDDDVVGVVNDDNKTWHVPNAAIVSDALALSYWLSSQQHALSNNNNNNNNQPPSSVDLQRALIMCPNNPMAREIPTAQLGT